MPIYEGYLNALQDKLRDSTKNAETKLADFRAALHTRFPGGGFEAGLADIAVCMYFLRAIELFALGYGGPEEAAFCP